MLGIFFQPYQQANNNSKISILKINLFLLIGIVNFFYSDVFAQPEDVDPNGYNVFYYSNGKKSSEGYLEDGKPNGYWITYYENGEKKTEGNRVNFELDSAWIFYNEKGIISQIINYQNGFKNGILQKYDTLGHIKSHTNFVNNLKQGEAVEFYPSGEVRWQKNHVDDKLEGMAYEYDTSGNIISIREYTSGFLRNEEIINRFDKDGNKHGIWKEFYDNGKLKWEGEFLHGELNGIVKEYNKKGGLKTLEKYEFGEVDTESEEVVFFELEKEIRPDGSMLVGGYNNNMKQGIFREYDSTGVLIASYEYKDDKKLAVGLLDTSGAKTGAWTFYYETGELKAEGNFIGGIKVNEWKYYFKNGDLQQKGGYKNGLPHRNWSWWYENRQLKREESYLNGKEDGVVIEYDTLGNILTSGEYIIGIQDGKWFYNVNDHTEEGEFRDDVRHGVWIYKYKDGTLAFKGEYINGLAIGKHKYYYPNGRIYWEGKYDGGLKDGEWTKYNEDGTISIQIVYKRGEEHKINGVKLKKIEG